LSIYSAIAISQATALANATIGRFDFFVDSLDNKFKAYDDNNDLVEDITSIDASSVPYSITVPSDWDGSPSDVQAALDELASRVKSIEAKTDLITVTQAVDLDQMEADIAQNTADIFALTTSYNRRKKVAGIVNPTLPPSSEFLGQRFILGDDAGAVDPSWDGANKLDIVEYDGVLWVANTPEEGWVTYVDSINKDALFVNDGSPTWEIRPVAVEDHNDLQNIQGGAVGDYQHLTTTEKDRIPSSDEKGALQGTNGAPSDSNRYVTNTDPRLTDSRDPNSHASTHTDGTDDIQDATTSQKGLMTAAQAQEQVDIRTTSGTAPGATDNGTFTGTTIPDNSNTKAALQSLETAVEGISPGGQVDSVNSGTNINVDNTDPANPIVNVVSSPSFGGSGSFGGALAVGGPITSVGIAVVLDNDPRLIYGAEYNQFYSQPLSITSAPHTTWVNKVNGNTTSLPVGNYLVNVSYGWNHNAANSDFESRLLFDGSILGDIFTNGVTHKQEPKDTAGGGNPSGTTQQHGFSKSFPVSVVAPGPKPVVLDFRSDDAADISGIWEALIEIYRVS